MYGCCCVANGQVVEWALPVEPDQNLASAMAKIPPRKDAKGARGEDDDGEAAYEELKVGMVRVEEGESQGLALLHSQQDDLVVIAGVIKGGPWDKWNESHPEHMVQACDRIVEVNEKQRDSARIVEEMTAKLAKSRNMTLVIRRPFENHIVVPKPSGDSLGLVLLPMEDGQLFIHKISDAGCIGRWNSENPAQLVKALDKVVRVGKVSGEANEMTEALKQDGCDLDLVLMTHS
mmetsp:Transcript_46105/g.133615  ORF Transcript_46105/g.133615 Transcript_46105/m.133615 type:complete len:233 (+) Transcript_46105:61-759(+)